MSPSHIRLILVYASSAHFASPTMSRLLNNFDIAGYDATDISTIVLAECVLPLFSLTEEK